VFQKKVEELLFEIESVCRKVKRDPQEIKIVVASKYFTVEQMQELAGIPRVIFGENRVQDAIQKMPFFPHHRFHLIGHLQTNKVKPACELFEMIQSVDSIRLLEKLHDQAKGMGVRKKILLQANLNQEVTQYGFSKEDLQNAYEFALKQEFLEVCGLMVIGAKQKNDENCFNLLKYFFDKFKKEYNHPSFNELSMGMSQDFQLAIECGSTMIRVGSYFKG
jgi:pyridoxal phosphate enzyme (YggS family)